MKSSEICAALRNRFKQPEWALFFEVANGTGANAKRHADALAMNMYPSRGLSVIGFEIKVSRGDLKRELENPDKAEEIARFCNEWYLVVPEGLIKSDDLIPLPWGIMECKDGNLTAKKKAEQLQPQAVTKDFVAAVLRSAGKMDEKALQDVRNEAYRAYAKSRDEEIKSQVDRETKRLKAIAENIEEFERITGEKIGQYTDVEGLAERFKMAKDIQKVYGTYGTLNGVCNSMERFLNETRKLIGSEAIVKS